MANEKSPSNGNLQPQGNVPHVRIVTQYIKDLSFESPGAPLSLQKQTEQPNLQVEVNVGAKPIEKDAYECVIDFKANVKTPAATIYNLELVYGGVFVLTNFPQDAVHPMLFVNCPALLFPFVRRLIADITRDSGFPPLWLDPIDWGALYTRRLGELKAQGASGAPTVA